MARRILLLVTDLEIGGTPTVVRELAIRLRAPDVEVEVACLKRWGPVADQLRDAGVRVTAFGASRPWHLPRVVRQLRGLVRERQIDTIFSFLVHANLVAARAVGKLPGVRLLESIQTVQPRPRWHWWVQRRAQRSADRVVVPSTAVATIARERCGVDDARILVISNAIDPAAFTRVDVFRGPKTRVGFIGRLDPVKNLPVLINALRWMDDLPNVECHIFGEGPSRRALERLIEWWKLHDRAHLRGAVSKPQEALREMDVLVSPSPYEGFGLVLIEAMAAGVPVIAANAGGARDVVQHGINGLLVSSIDKELGTCVRSLTEDAELRANLIDAGLRTVREKFTWDVVLPQYRQLLGLQEPR